MGKGTLRPLFQTTAPSMVAGGESEGEFLIVEATPKPDGVNGHRYWGVFTRPDETGWVTPLHADVTYPSGDMEVEPDAVLMGLGFRMCPATHVATMARVAGAMDNEDLQRTGLFMGTFTDWVEAIGYDVLDVPEADEFAEANDA